MGQINLNPQGVCGNQNPTELFRVEVTSGGLYSNSSAPLFGCLHCENYFPFTQSELSLFSIKTIISSYPRMHFSIENLALFSKMSSWIYSLQEHLSFSSPKWSLLRIAPEKPAPLHRTSAPAPFHLGGL